MRSTGPPDADTTAPTSRRSATFVRWHPEERLRAHPPGCPGDLRALAFGYPPAPGGVGTFSPRRAVSPHARSTSLPQARRHHVTPEPPGPRGGRKWIAHSWQTSTRGRGLATKPAAAAG